MLEKVLHCFSKYHHIYEYIGTDKKSWKEIKWHLVHVLDVGESTARAQMEVALAKENGVVIEEDGLYRLNRELIQMLIKYFIPLYPVRLRVFTQKKWHETNQEIVKWIKEFLKEAYKSTKLEYELHKTKAECHKNHCHTSDAERLYRDEHNKEIDTFYRLQKMKVNLRKDGIDVDE